MIKYLELYRDYLIVNKGNSIKTVEAYLSDIKQYFKIIEKGDIDDYLKFLYLQGYSASSQNRKISALNDYYKFLILYKYCNFNPFNNLDYAKVEKHIPDCLTYKEVLMIIDYTKDNLLDNALIEVLYGCGLRVSELVNLKVSDIHYKEKTIECRGKGNKYRLVPINKKALLAINEYKINYRDKLKNKDGTNLLFLNKFGKPIYREYVNRMLEKIEKDLNLNKHLHPHLFRHTFSTHLLENGANLRLIQTMLGHQNITTTEIYTHINEKKLIDDYNKYFKE